MAMTCYYKGSELEQWCAVGDSDLNELFQEVRTTFGGKHFLRESNYKKKSLFHKPKRTTLYELIIRIDPVGRVGSENSWYEGQKFYESQIFNFPSEGKSSICAQVPKVNVYTLFLGLINGYNEAKRE
jgi:hypothetical protein